MRLRGVEAELDDRPRRLLDLRPPRLADQHPGEAEPGGKRVGLQTQRGAVGLLGRRYLAILEEDLAQVAVGPHVVGLEVDGRLEGPLGVSVASLPVERDAEATVQRR